MVLARSVGGYKGIDLAELVNEALCSTKTKDDFKSGINKRIQQSIDWNFKDLGYEDDSNKIFNILLLFNVETNYQSEYEPYPFKFHKSKNWSLEHIHARNSEKFDKNNKDQWKTWLEYHLPILEKKEQTPEIQQLIDQVKRYLGNPDRLSWEKFDYVFNQMHQYFNQNDDGLDHLDSLSNLALLGMNDNSALNNSIFEVKCKKIIEIDKAGQFIPVCTRRVFLKYYTKDPDLKQRHFWSAADRQGYIEKIEEVLGKYNKY